MLESKLQEKVLARLKELGYWTVRVVHTTRSGTMDIICCSPTGQFVGIELKVGHNKPSALQIRAIEEVRARKGLAFVAYSIEELEQGLKGLGPAQAVLPTCASDIRL